MHPETGKTITGKCILLISPHSWGKMFISKHHYAVELARLGNKVYFLNPPNRKLYANISINRSEEYEGLHIIDHKLWFPYRMRYHAKGLFHFLMQWHIKKILANLDHTADIIWSFDLNNLYPFRLFPASACKIFHPVDEPLTQSAIEAAQGAGIIISVTQEILQKYAGYPVPKYLINHGISEDFLVHSSHVNNTGVIKVGFSGNLMRHDIDRGTLLTIIAGNPFVIFECWGSYKKKDGNIGGDADEPTKTFVEKLQSFPNVILHGVVTPAKLASELHRMEAFIICYDIEKDQSRGTNYHKIMEYLSTGKVIVSNNVTAYAGQPGLIVMPEERMHNKKLPGLFTDVIRDLSFYNSKEKQEIRKQFAYQNKYSNHIKTIASFLK